MNWKEISFVTGHQIRFKILICLKNEAKIPTKISEQINIPISHVSEALKELSEKNLVKCNTPDARKNKFYSITKNGIKVLSTINELTDLDNPSDF